MHGGLPEVHSLRIAVRNQVRENTGLMQRNRALQADVYDLKHGNEAIEARARWELGLIKPDEVFYQIIPDASIRTSTPAVIDHKEKH